MGIVQQIGKAFGLDIVFGEAALHGQSRTVFAETNSGESLVIKWSADAEWATWLPTAVKYAEALRARGYPAPATVHYGEVVGIGYAWVQERLPGEPTVNGLNRDLLDQVIAAVHLQTDAYRDITLPDTGSWSWIPAVVFDDEEGWWKTARNLNADVVDLCDRLDAWVRELPRPPLRQDWVHLDLNFSNILSSKGHLTGIIDLDHLGVGDRSIDLACIAFEYERLRFNTGITPIPDATVIVRDQVLHISGEAGWRQALTYCCVARLGWTSATGFRIPIDEALTVSQRLFDQSLQLAR